jgi:hypothetical protein
LGVLSAIIDALYVEWSGVTRRLNFSDPTNTLAGYFLENSASIDVTVTTLADDGSPAFTFVSEATHTTFAEVAHDHNGVFFPGDEQGVRYQAPGGTDSWLPYGVISCGHWASLRCQLGRGPSCAASPPVRLPASRAVAISHMPGRTSSGQLDNGPP